MGLHFEPILYMVRGYRDGDADLQFMARAPFDLIFSAYSTQTGHPFHGKLDSHSM